MKKNKIKIKTLVHLKNNNNNRNTLKGSRGSVGSLLMGDSLREELRKLLQKVIVALEKDGHLVVDLFDGLLLLLVGVENFQKALVRLWLCVEPSLQEICKQRVAT